MANSFNSNSDLEKIVKFAKQFASENNHQYFTVEHLLLSMLHEKSFISVLETIGVDVQQLVKEVEDYIFENVPVNTANTVEPKKTQIIERI